MLEIRSNRIFRFGYVTTWSFGLIELGIQTPDHIPRISILLTVVDVYIPALIGLDVLDGNFPLVDNISHCIWHRVIISEEPL